MLQFLKKKKKEFHYMNIKDYKKYYKELRKSCIND